MTLIIPDYGADPSSLQAINGDMVGGVAGGAGGGGDDSSSATGGAGEDLDLRCALHVLQRLTTSIQLSL